MTMKTSKAGILAILDHEAVVLTPYKDVVGVWTVAVGHTRNAGPPDPRHIRRLNLEEALHIFETDLAKFEKRVNDAVKVPIAQHEFDALVSFDFNTGAVHRATLTKTLNAGDHKKSGAQFMNWKKPKAIIGRRKKEQALFLTGKYPNITKLKVYDKYPGKMRLVPAPPDMLKVATPEPQKIAVKGLVEAPDPAPPTPPIKPRPAPPRGFIAWFLSLFK